MIDSVRKWALQNLDRPLSVLNMAEHAHMSPRTFARRFHAQTGSTPARWLTEQRLAEARRLLEATSLSIEAIAAHSGLRTADTLRFHLARELEVTPTAYRAIQRSSWPPAT